MSSFRIKLIDIKRVGLTDLIGNSNTTLTQAYGNYSSSPTFAQQNIDANTTDIILFPTGNPVVTENINSGNNGFTITQAGTYCIIVSMDILPRDEGANHTTTMNLLKNNQVICSNRSELTGGSPNSFNLSKILTLSQDDLIQVELTTTNSACEVSTPSFTIFKLS